MTITVANDLSAKAGLPASVAGKKSLWLAEYKARLADRYRTQQAVLNGGEMAQAAEKERCRRDVEHFIDTWLWTFDPRLEPKDRPFILYPHQRDLLRWILDRMAMKEDGLLEKSRDMGATWTILALIFWHWLFEPAFPALLGSRKEDLCDNYTLDSLMGRLDYFLRNLPPFLRPKDYTETRHRRLLKMENPETGAIITGESSNANFGRQSRYRLVVMDEHAFWSETKESWRSAGDATTTRLSVSSPNERNMEFHAIRNSGVKVFSLPWNLHPLKDDAWLEQERKRRTEEEFQQEVLMSYFPTQSLRVYPEWEDVPKGDYGYVPGWPLFTSWDFGMDGGTAIIWWQENPQTRMYRAIDCYEARGQPIDFYVPFITARIGEEEKKFPYTSTDLAKVSSHMGWPMSVNFGDPQGRQRDMVSGISPITHLARRGVYITSRTMAEGGGPMDFSTRRDSTKRFLRRLEGVNYPLCAALDRAMLHARYPNRDQETTSPILLPVHDWTSHLRTAVEFMAVNIELFQPGRAFKAVKLFKRDEEEEPSQWQI